MSEYYEEYRKRVVEKYFKKRTALSQQEYDSLHEEDKPKFNLVDNKYVMYENAVIEDHEVSGLVQLKTLEEISELNRQVGSIRKILIFWTVFVIIALVFAFTVH